MVTIVRIVATEKEDSEMWEKYTGKYSKVDYMVKTKNGDIYGPCWPNAGEFHLLDGSNKVIHGTFVAEVCEVDNDKFDYNGPRSNLMDDIYEGLKTKVDLDEPIDWATFSLYLARVCSVLEREVRKWEA